jgi:HMG (high mobility group) box
MANQGNNEISTRIISNNTILALLYMLQPKRPLHAYNIFFQRERQVILANLPEPTPDAETATKEKRRRRATHGKISFARLAKEIGQKWQTLDKKEKEHFQHFAEIDLKRYDDEMEVYNQQQKPPAKEKGKEKNQNQQKKGMKILIAPGNHQKTVHRLVK